MGVKPLALFASVLVVGLIAIWLGMRMTNHPVSASAASAAPPVPTRLTRAQFVHAANRVCGRELREAKTRGVRHPKIKSLRALKRIYRIVVPMFDKEADGVRALRPPLSEAVLFRRLTRNLSASQRNAHSILHALETGQIRRALSFSKQQDKLDTRMNAESRKLGLTVCAKS
jgi:hypothetical protein